MDGWMVWNEHHFTFHWRPNSASNNCIIRVWSKQPHRETEWKRGMDWQRDMYVYLCIHAQDRKQGRNQEWHAIVSNIFHSLHLQSSKFVNTKSFFRSYTHGYVVYGVNIDYGSSVDHTALNMKLTHFSNLFHRKGIKCSNNSRTHTAHRTQHKHVFLSSQLFGTYG